jgi:parallel beta-helix repeat protein
MRRRDLQWAVFAVGLAPGLAAACSGDHGAGDAGAGGPGDAGGPDAAPPAARCERPALYDVSAPTATVGDGSPASCTAAALQQAASAGGTIVFRCGAAPVTIAVASQIVITRPTVLDGGGLVTLDGGGASRILLLDSGYDTPNPRLVVQRLAFRNGRSPATGADTAQGGAAIYRDGGSLTVLDSVFEDNHGPATGQDVAGGAIYGFGGGDTIVAGSSFTGNAASDGGAIGSLNSDLTVINSSFTGNAATGTGGNPGNGGCGGAIYMDGGHEAASLCGVVIRGNSAGAIGGGVFRVSNDHTGSFAMERSTVDSNRVTASGSGNAGGLYLEGLALTINGSTISRNQAFYNGGIWINTCSVAMTNTTIAENTATGSNGGGIWLGHTPTGEIRNCTIANNHSTAANQIAGAIFGDGLSLVNTIVAGNTAMYTPGCNVARSDGSGDLQWPGGSLCSHAPLVADPMLGALGDHGGDSETLVPAAESPARGLGHSCPMTDQRGQPRAEPCTAGTVELP